MSHSRSFGPFATTVLSSDVNNTLTGDNINAEPWEGQLITVEGITIDSFNSTRYEYTGHSRGYNVIINDQVDVMYQSIISLDIGSTYNVNGILTFDNGQYKLNPRKNYDIRPGVAIDENASNVNVSVYPNPAVDMVRFTGEISNVVLFNAMGQKMNVLIENNTMTISNIASGIYTARITMQNGEVVNRTIVKK